MRKTFITVIIITLIVSILGTGIVVYFDVTHPVEAPLEYSETK